MKQPKIADVLTEAKRLITKGWTRDIYAADAEGDPIPWDDPKACHFCASGAVYRAIRNLTGKTMTAFADNKVLALLEEHPVVAHYDADIAWFNDKQTNKVPVLQVFDDVIKKLQK
jgi:hypothetical protein